MISRKGPVVDVDYSRVKRTLVTTFLTIVFASCCILALRAQDVDAGGPQLHSRPQRPNEQLLPQSAVPKIEPPNRKQYPQKYSSVYMPISLAPGRIRTPEFPAGKHSQLYDIMLQLEKPLPFLRMQCMVGVTNGPLDAQYCDKDDPILRASWTVWENEHIVYWGLISHGCGCIFTDKNIFKLIGSFAVEAGKMYVVQVRFTKDGTPLNVANPHLLVIPHEDMW